MRRKAIRTNCLDVYAHLSTCKHNAAVSFMSYMCVLCSIRLRVSVVHVIPLSIFSYYFLDNVLKLFAFFYAYKLFNCFVLFYNFISKCKHHFWCEKLHVHVTYASFSPILKSICCVVTLSLIKYLCMTS